MEEASGLTSIPIEEIRKILKELEAEGLAFQAKDEISGKILWFHSTVLEDQNVQ